MWVRLHYVVALNESPTITGSPDAISRRKAVVVVEERGGRRTETDRILRDQWQEYWSKHGHNLALSSHLAQFAVSLFRHTTT